MRISKHANYLLLILLVIAPLQAFAGKFDGMRMDKQIDIQVEHYKSRQHQDDTIINKAKELEGIMISHLIRPLFPERKEGGFMGASEGESTFRMMLVNEYGQIISRSGGLGVAESIAKKLGHEGENNDVIYR